MIFFKYQTSYLFSSTNHIKRKKTVRYFAQQQFLTSFQNFRCPLRVFHLLCYPRIKQTQELSSNFFQAINKLLAEFNCYLAFE